MEVLLNGRPLPEMTGRLPFIEHGPVVSVPKSYEGLNHINDTARRLLGIGGGYVDSPNRGTGGANLPCP